MFNWLNQALRLILGFTGFKVLFSVSTETFALCLLL